MINFEVLKEKLIFSRNLENEDSYIIYDEIEDIIYNQKIISIDIFQLVCYGFFDKSDDVEMMHRWGEILYFLKESLPLEMTTKEIINNVNIFIPHAEVCYGDFLTVWLGSDEKYIFLNYLNDSETNIKDLVVEQLKRMIDYGGDIEWYEQSIIGIKEILPLVK